MIRVDKINEAFLRIDSDDPEFAYDLCEKLTFKLPGYQHMPAFKKSKGAWDGSIRMFSPHSGVLYYGHLGILAQFASEKGYKLSFSDDVIDFNNLNDSDIDRLLDNAKVPSHFERRDYQYLSSIEALNLKRLIIESPTASGKSFIAYIMMLYFLESKLVHQATDQKIALIVPRKSLVEQMYSDFEEYGMDVETHCARLYDKYKDHYPKQPILITTWQSISKKPQDYFHQFSAIIGDEAHGFKASSLRYIMENSINAQYRIGMTGTVPKEKNAWLTVQGLFGPTFKVTNTKKLQKQGYLNKMSPIEVHMLQYPDEERQKMKGAKYQDEISYLIDNESRNNYLKNIAIRAEGNTLLLFSRVEKHGKPLYNKIVNSTDRPVYFISGGVKVEEREKIRHLVKSHDNAIIVASIGTFSTGVNIPNLDTLIIASPTKSHITLVQMIGRVLRKSKRATQVVDVVDDLSWEKEKNYALNHAMQRIKIYAEQEFDYVFKPINLGEDYE